ncbi:MAG: hypothetical protein Q9165_006011 [Trypethelium subeluteriae]
MPIDASISRVPPMDPTQNNDVDRTMEEGLCAAAEKTPVSPVSTAKSQSALIANAKPLEDCPAGYPSLAAFLDSDEAYMVYRRFGFLQSRLLLEKQDEMRKLEKRIDRADASAAKTDPETLKTRDLNEGDAAPRRALFKQAEAAFRDYGSSSR